MEKYVQISACTKSHPHHSSACSQSRADIASTCRRPCCFRKVLGVDRMRKISESIAHRVISAYLELVGLGNHCQQGAQQRQLGLQQGSAERPGLWERLWVPLQMHNTCMHAS